MSRRPRSGTPRSPAARSTTSRRCGTASASSCGRVGHHRLRRADHGPAGENYTTSSHDESDTGQQELYVALRGSGAVVAGEMRLPLDAEHLVRVDAGVDRVLTSGSDGLRVLCVGGVPGAAYTAPEWTAPE